MAVIYDDFKLIGNSDRNATLDEFELYNLKNDSFESTNIGTENKEKVTELKAKLDFWYDDIMSSPNIITSPRIIIGSKKEKHTILNRNDARGLPLIWDDDSMHVRWDLDIVENGNYKIKCHFRNPIKKAGNMVLRIGQQNFTQNIQKKNVQTVVYPTIYLKKGICALDAWYYIQWKEHFTPFYIEIEKNN